jgi:putative ABC transport system permease protein
MTAQWKKVLADFWSNKLRSLLVALSVASGVFAVGLIATSFTLIQHDMEVDYTSANPHTAQIFFESFDEALLQELRGTPDVETMDARYNLWIKVNDSGGRPYQINIHSIQDVGSIRVDKLVYEAGARDLTNGQLLMERQGAEGLGLKIGDPVELVLADGTITTLPLAGTVHDVSANPFVFNKLTSAYVTPTTMAALGGEASYNFVTLVTSGSHTDKDHIRAIASQVAERIKASGREVQNINITNPGQHPAKSIIDTVLTLLSALGVMVVFLSGFLVVNTISALMGQQIRQIGVMKALGATFWQVLGMYFALVTCFGLLALLIAVPLSALASYALTAWMDGMLNANMTGFFLPAGSLTLQVLIGLVVPLAAALLPVISGARQTVRQAISSCSRCATPSGAKAAWRSRSPPSPWAEPSLSPSSACGSRSTSSSTRLSLTCSLTSTSIWPSRKIFAACKP